MQNKQLSLAVATLLKIREKHKAAASFELQSLVLEMEQEFTDGKLALTCGIRGLKYVDFPCDEAREIALQLFENKLIPDYTLEEKDSVFEENEYMARYSPFDMSQVHELNRELQKLVKSTEQDTKSITEAANIIDDELNRALAELDKPTPQRELNADLIMKYLKNKGGRATLKQIQSRFKGYLNNTCEELTQRCFDCGCSLYYSDPFKISQTVVEG